ESLRIHHELGDRWRMTSVLDALAATDLARGDALPAVRLLAAATTLREEIGTPVPPVERQDRERSEAHARAALGLKRYDGAWRAGSAEVPRDVVRAVLAEEPPPPPPDTPRLRLIAL
ncbi:MAG: hypothetical protein ACRDQB_12440, partial [Thermocrispum sp.]